MTTISSSQSSPTLSAIKGFAEVNGAKLYYEVMGEGQPLVLIHEGIVDRRMWDDQFGVFAQHYRVIRYDVRGFGYSQTSESSTHMPITYSDHQDLEKQKPNPRFIFGYFPLDVDCSRRTPLCYRSRER